MKHLWGREGQRLKYPFGEGQKAKLERRDAWRLWRGKRSGVRAVKRDARRLRLGTEWDCVWRWNRASADPVWPVQPVLAGPER